MRRLGHAPVWLNEMNIQAPEIGLSSGTQCTFSRRQIDLDAARSLSGFHRTSEHDMARESLPRYLAGHRGDVLLRGTGLIVLLFERWRPIKVQTQYH